MKKIILSLVLVLAGVSVGHATTRTVSATGGVTVSSTAFASVGEAIRIQVKVGETVSYTYGGTSTGTLKLQSSRDGQNWSTITSVVANGTVSSSGTQLVESPAEREVLYRFFVSTRTAGSFNVTLSDADDLVKEYRNHKNIVVLQVKDDSLAVTGTFSASTTTLTNLLTSGSLATGAATFTAGTVSVSTATSSTSSLCFKGSYATLPTSGVAEGCLAYQVSDHKLYISTIAVTNAGCWAAAN